MRTAHKLPYRKSLCDREPLDRDPPPGQRPSPWTETLPLDRDPPPGQRPSPWTETLPLDRDPPTGQRPSPWTETLPLDRDPQQETPCRETLWTEIPLWTDRHL